MPSIGHGSMTFIDQAGRASVQRLSSVVLTSGNIVAQTAAWVALVAQTELMSAGTLTKDLLGNLNNTPNPVLPTPPASRADKFAVTYIDTTSGDTYTTQIPVAGPSLVTFLPGTRLLDPAHDPYMTYITLFQAFVQSEEGHSVTIKQTRWIGRHI